MNIENLKSARKSTGMTQKDVSTALNISPNTYKNYEQGLREPNGDTIVMLANLFGVTTDYLLGRPEATPPSDPIEEFAEKTRIPNKEKAILAKWMSLESAKRQTVLNVVSEIMQEYDAADKTDQSSAEDQYRKEDELYQKGETG